MLIVLLRDPADIFKNEKPTGISTAFSFFKISECFVNQPLVDDQGLRISSRLTSGEMLPALRTG